MKKFIFLPLWFICSIAFTGACLLGIQKVRTGTAPVVLSSVEHDTILQTDYTVKEGEVKGLSTVYEAEDARPAIISNFLERYKSPLTPYDQYGKDLVAIADKYHLDYRLLPAIAMQESNLCKKVPSNSYNCLGFGVTATTTFRFDSYLQAFEAAAKSLEKNYINKGLTTPEKIMARYTPSSTTWANSVNQWIADMEHDDKKLGKELKKDADLLEYTSAEAPATPAQN